MTNDEIVEKIKSLRKTLANLEIEMAKNEERIKNQEKLKEQYLKELSDLGMNVSIDTLVDTITSLETELEANLSLIELEIQNVKKQIAKNNE